MVPKWNYLHRRKPPGGASNLIRRYRTLLNPTYGLLILRGRNEGTIERDPSLSGVIFVPRIQFIELRTGTYSHTRIARAGFLKGFDAVI